MTKTKRVSRWPKASAASFVQVAGAFTLLLFASYAEAQRAGAFAALSGSWSGSGTISLAGGTRESIRCRATYNVDGSGNNLRQSLLCASDSYRFELRSNVAAQGSAISGNWAETTRNVEGYLTGQVTAQNIQVQVESLGFSATLTLVTQGGRQSISIRSPGHDFTGVNITLARR
jgi:hypothetical protein